MRRSTSSKARRFLGVIARGLATTVLLTAGVVNPVRAADPAGRPAARYGLPYPFTGEQLWAKLRTIIDTPGGDVTPQQVQNILGVRLRAKWEGYPPNQYIEYSAEMGKAYPFRIFTDNSTYFSPALHKRLLFRSFSASWHRTGPHGEFQQPEICMPADIAISELKIDGWLTKRGYHQHDRTRGNELIRDNSDLQLRTSLLIEDNPDFDPCLLGISMITRPKAYMEP